MRQEVHAFLLSAAAAHWRVCMLPAEWDATLAAVPKMKAWSGACALRALAVLHRRDIVLLNGLPGSTEPRVTVFYSDPRWLGNFAGAGLLYDLCPPGSAALLAWMQSGTPISAGGPVPSGDPMFLLYNGTNHFDAVDRRPLSVLPEQRQQQLQLQRRQQLQPHCPQLQEDVEQQQQQQRQQQRLQKPKPTALPPPSEPERREAARASFAAAVAARGAAELCPSQHRAQAFAACAAILGGPPDKPATLRPCFMCGDNFARLKGHWATHMGANQQGKNVPSPG
jgi:hypothetical protein